MARSNGRGVFGRSFVGVSFGRAFEARVEVSFRAGIVGRSGARLDARRLRPRFRRGARFRKRFRWQPGSSARDAFAMASTPAAATAATFFLRATSGGGCVSAFGCLRGGRFGGIFVRIFGNVGNLAEDRKLNFAFTLFANAGANCGRFLGRRISRSGERDSQASERFFGFLFPVSAPEALGGDDVPAASFVGAAGFFFDRAEFPRHHCVAGALVKFGKFGGRVGAIFRLADARLDLSPISHVEAL